MTSSPVLIDAHHHLWDLARRPQHWLDDPALAAIRRTFTPDDLRSTATRRIAGRRLHGTVVVQCVPDVSETEDLLALAEQEPLIGAVVGWADLTSPAIGDLLDELLAGPGGTYLQSLRHLVQGETDRRTVRRLTDGPRRTVTAPAGVPVVPDRSACRPSRRSGPELTKTRVNRTDNSHGATV